MHGLTAFLCLSAIVVSEGSDAVEQPEPLSVLILFDSSTMLPRVQLLIDLFAYLSKTTIVKSTMANKNDDVKILIENMKTSLTEIKVVISFLQSVNLVKQLKHYSSVERLQVIQISFNQVLFDPRKETQFSPTNYMEFMAVEKTVLNVLRDLFGIIEPYRMYVLYQQEYAYAHETTELLTVQQERATIFEPFSKTPAERAKQLKNVLQHSPLLLILMANTSYIESYLEEIQCCVNDSGQRWIVLNLDSNIHFKLVNERNANISILWIRAANIRSLDNVDTFHMWRKKERAEMEHYSTFLDPVLSFYYDIAMDCLVFHNMLLEAKNYLNNAGRSARAESVYFYHAIQLRNNRTSYGPYFAYENGRVFQDALLKIYRIQTEEDCKRTQMIGTWTLKAGLNLFYSTGLNQPDPNHYRIAYVLQPPFIESYRDENGDWKLRGYSLDLINQIQELLNFTYDLYEVKQGTFGRLNNIGRWNGIIGDIVQGDADISFAGMTASALRESYVDFTFPHFDLSGQTIIMKRVETENSIFKFATVLELPVWASIIGSFMFTSFLLWMFDYCSPYSYRNNKELYKDDLEKREFTFKESLWFCMNSLTPQGGGEIPKNLSGRIIAATWWLFGFIIIASYTANLAAFLTVSRMETKISDLQDLARQYKLKYAPVKNSSAATYFKRMTEIEYKFYDTWKEMGLNASMSTLERARLAVWDYPVSDTYTNMWRYIQETGMPNTLEEGLERVLASDDTEQFALIAESSVLRFIALTDCRFKVVGEDFNKRPFAVAVQQGSCLKDDVSNAILRLLNERKLEILKEKWWKKHPDKQDCPRDDAVPEGLSVSSLGGVFVVILLGMAFCLVSLIMEYFLFKRKMKKCLPISSSPTNNVSNGGAYNNDDHTEHRF